MRVDFIVNGEAVGKERPRVYGRHAITPEKTKLYEAQVGWEYARAAKKKGVHDFMTPPIAIRCVSFHKPPKSWTKKKREAAYGKLWVGKPDGDNILKSILDGLSGVAIKDDSEVPYQIIEKRYTRNEDEESYTIVNIWEVDE